MSDPEPYEVPRERWAQFRPHRNQSTPPVRAAATERARPKCPNDDCDLPDIRSHDGQLMCFGCGTVLDDSNFVNDVDFAETSAGAAVVQGSYVASDKRYASTMNGKSRRTGGVISSHEITYNRGRDELRKVAFLLKIDDSIFDRASLIYNIAVKLNCIQGRRVREVAACCLYIASRQLRDDGSPRYMLLIDFADAIKVNVYRLGQVYRDLKNQMFMDDEPDSQNPRDPSTVPDRPLAPVIEVEELILRYAKKLEFGPGEAKVANDAARILRRMKRDWIVTGRIPSGIIGASLILAARMNNYRRTVRELVYIVKAANMTISKRIDEFTRTTSGNISIQDFRDYSDRMKTTAIPPSVYEREQRESRKRSLEQMEEGSQDNPQVIEGTPASEDQVRRDADGFAIPAAPARSAQVIDPALGGDEDKMSPAPSESTETRSRSGSAQPPSKRQKRVEQKRAYKKKLARIQYVITHEDLDEETALENEIETILHDPESIANMEETKLTDYLDKAKLLADARREAERQGKHSRQSAAGTKRKRLDSDVDNPEVDLDAYEISEEEFNQDPEIANCVLSVEDADAKEQIWISQNEDWLRDQQRRTLKKLVDEATAAANPQVQQPKPKKRRGRIGDGSLLNDGREPPKDAVEATKRMLDRRAPKNWSKFIDIERYRKAFGGSNSSAASSDAGSNAGDTDSRAGSATPAPRERTSGSVERSGSVETSSHSSRPGSAPASPAPRASTARRASTAPRHSPEKARANSSAAKSPDPAKDSIRNLVGEEGAKEWFSDEEEEEDYNDFEADDDDEEEAGDEDETLENVQYDDDEEVGFSDEETFEET